MQFAINDKVIHPRHGAGTITGVQQRAAAAEIKSYFVIEIPAQRLTVYVPCQQMEQIGVRLATPSAKLPRILATLQSPPLTLPEDYEARQAGVAEKLGTGLVIQLAEVVRDLTWHRQQARLTKKDSEYLSRSREWLAAELALASDIEVAEANRAIDEALAAGMDGPAMQG